MRAGRDAYVLARASATPLQLRTQVCEPAWCHRERAARGVAPAPRLHVTYTKSRRRELVDARPAGRTRPRERARIDDRRGRTDVIGRDVRHRAVDARGQARDEPG